MGKGLNGALLSFSWSSCPEIPLHTSELELPLPSQMHHQTNGRSERSQSFESRSPLASSFVSRIRSWIGWEGRLSSHLVNMGEEVPTLIK